MDRNGFKNLSKLLKTRYQNLALIVQILKQEEINQNRGIFMKALIISSLLFFSLRAMSAEVGEDKKGDCIASNQSNKREAKVVVSDSSDKKPEPAKTISK